MPADPRVIGSPRRPAKAVSNLCTRAISTDRPPTLANRVHSPVPHLPFGVPSPVLPVAPFRVDHFCQGFFPLRDVTDGVHLARKLPLPLCSVLRFSQPLDGLRHHRLCRLISSRCHVQGYSVQGFLPSRSRVDSSPTTCPLAVNHPAAHRRCHRLPRSNGPTSRLCSADRHVPRGWC